MERLKELKGRRGCGLDRANERQGGEVTLVQELREGAVSPLEKSRSASWKRWHFTWLVRCWWTSGEEWGFQNSGWPGCAGRSAPAKCVSCAVSCISCKCGHCHCAKLLQACPTLCDPLDCNLPGSSVHGIFHTRLLEWVVIALSRGSSLPRD